MYLLRDIWQRLSWRLLVYWGLLLGAIWLFTELAETVYEQDGFFFDEPVLNWFYNLLNPTLTPVMLGLSAFGGVLGMIILSVVVTLLLFAVKRREAFFFGSSMLGASVIMVATKYLFARPRPELFPDVNLWQTGSPSFPSGHATGSAAFFLALYLVVAHVAPRWRPLAAVVGAAMALAISASRLYLQVHYPSDILAGIALGLGWVLGVNSLYAYRSRNHSRRTVLLSLSRDLLERYEQRARNEGKSRDAVISEVLASAAGNPASTEADTPPHTKE